MRWEDMRRSRNVQDRRGARRAMPVTGGIGIVIVIVIALLTGTDPMQLLEGGLDTGAPTEASAPAANDEASQFVSAILGSTEDTWDALFQSSGSQYPHPSLVLFTGSTPSACGMGQSAMGPFYCPGDQSVYIDLAFFDDLRSRYAAPGDFAQAYVIAHEVGHHVQNVLGTMRQVHEARARQGETEANANSVRLELQADCYAGLWAHHAERARPMLERGDVEEALAAATAIGDDRLQRQSQGVVIPESFTHGTSEQRVRWFRRGLDAGTSSACDTFSASRL